MALYRFFCTSCNAVTEILSRDNPACPYCAQMMRRDWRFHLGRDEVPEAHFNHTTGTVVHSKNDFRDQLKRLSEKATLNTGMEHRYEPVDLSDKKALGVTDEGLDATYRGRRDSGQDQPTKRIIV